MFLAKDMFFRTVFIIINFHNLSINPRNYTNVQILLKANFIMINKE